MFPYQGTTSKYLLVGLSKDGATKNVLVHRLVAETFIPNPDNLPEVDHIDKNIKNNKVSNLRWVNRQDNLKNANIDYSSLNGLKTKTRLFDPSGNLLGEFDSKTAAATYASENCGCSKSGMQKYGRSPSGYYLEMDDNPKLKQASERAKPHVWILYSPENEVIGEYKSVAEAGRYIKENIKDISIKLFQIQHKTYGYYVKEKGVETNK